MAPRMYRSANHRSRPGDPEIWFRIVHNSLAGPEPNPTASVREQVVEIAMGPNRAFDSGNVATLARRVPADQVVGAIPLRRRKANPPGASKTPRVVELIRKAIEWQALLESGETSSQAAIARQEGITRARVTQVMGLLRLAPEIREHILCLPNMVRRPAITERALRPIAMIVNAADQKARFQELMAHPS